MTDPTSTRSYEAPGIEERVKIDTPLVLTAGSGAVTCAVFHPQ
jgi:hypothetical protein